MEAEIFGSTTTTQCPQVCDRCGRTIGQNKGWREVQGWKICGVCQWEEDNRLTQQLKATQESLSMGMNNPTQIGYYLGKTIENKWGVIYWDGNKL